MTKKSPVPHRDILAFQEKLLSISLQPLDPEKIHTSLAALNKSGLVKILVYSTRSVKKIEKEESERTQTQEILVQNPPFSAHLLQALENTVPKETLERIRSLAVELFLKNMTSILDRVFPKSLKDAAGPLRNELRYILRGVCQMFLSQYFLENRPFDLVLETIMDILTKGMIPVTCTKSEILLITA